MKISEKNVLISTGILFLIVFAMLNLGKKQTAEQIDNQLNIEVASSSYNVNGGKLRLEFKKPAKEVELKRITIIDENDNAVSVDSKRENNHIIFDTYVPELNYKEVLKIVIVDAISTMELEIDYKIPENNIVAI
jgi:hypothetical protein